ncbi:hypothetical protein [Salinibacter ruber]|uniref:hypothetical protein n=1 Tax=Salinibacter ruber TaxID=146919 RepID=UPI0021697CF9|nr:hypothetical protein [Salinibacter ruber]MCS3695707.1 hypothetical protein [Salinibacter ruber]
MSNSLAIMTFGDKNFYSNIKTSVNQAKEIYPDAPVYIYDWGMKDRQIKNLNEEENVKEVIQWEKNDRDMSFIENKDWKKVSNEISYMREGKLLSFLKRLIRKTILKERSLEDRIKKIVEEKILGYERWNKISKKIEFLKKKNSLMAQKVYCTMDCIKRSKKKVLHMDADAFIIGSIDDLLNDKADVVVTMRRKNELKFGSNQCQVLNAGVILFNGDKKTNEKFVEKWIDRMEYMNEGAWIDQTALTRLIEDENKDIYDEYYSRGKVALNGGEASVLVVPCEKYNFNWIEEGVDKEIVKIVHFKSGRHSSKKFNKIL